MPLPLQQLMPYRLALAISIFLKIGVMYCLHFRWNNPSFKAVFPKDEVNEDRNSKDNFPHGYYFSWDVVAEYGQVPS